MMHMRNLKLKKIQTEYLKASRQKIPKYPLLYVLLMDLLVNSMARVPTYTRVLM